jgi:hypothetical protein
VPALPADTLEVVSTSPAAGATLTPTDNLQVTVHYNLTSAASGFLSVYLERFTDNQCRETDLGTYGATEAMQTVSGGDQTVTVSLPQIPFDAAYAGLGVVLSSDSSNTTVFVHDMNYSANCFATSSASIGAPPSLTDTITLISISPPAASGLTFGGSDIVATVQVDLVSGPGNIVMWFERFHDSACTVPGYDPSNNSTLNNTPPEPLAAGSQTFSISLPMPPLDTEYVGVGFRLWDEAMTSTLVILAYPVCYQVNY